MSTPKSTLWHIPYHRNPFFTGREDVIAQLHSSLQADATVALSHPQGISGLGGIGKTQTALEYAYRYRSDYNAIFWVRADSITSLNSSMIELAHVLNLPERHEQDQEIIVQAVLRWFRRESRWLLIFDNMDELSVAKPFLPKAGPGHIVFTTRSQSLGGIAQRLDVQKMEPEIGALLLLRRADLIALQAALEMANPDERHIARAISEELDGFPLALDQAGAYIKEAPCPLSEYLALYRTRRNDLLRTRGSSAQDYPESVATTWSLAFGMVREADAAAAELLCFGAYLAPDAIPESIIHGAIAIFQSPFVNSPLGKMAHDSLSFDRSMKTLLRYSLVARQADQGTFSIHRLVQAVLRDAVTDVEKHLMMNMKVIPALRGTFPDPGDVHQWNDCSRYIPHILECTHHILEEKLFFDSVAELLFTAGIYLQKQGRYREVEQCSTSSLQICQECGENVGVAANLYLLGMMYQSQRNYSQANTFYQQAQMLLESLPESQSGDVSWMVSTIEGNKAELSRDQGNFKQAANFYIQNLLKQQDVSAEIDPGRANTLNNFALFLTNQGKYEEAEALHLQVLAMRQRVLGNEHPEVSNSLNNLAVLYCLMRRYADAERNYRHALSIIESHYATDHPAIATTLQNLGELYRIQRQYDLAEDYLVKALTIREKRQESPFRTQCLISLGVLYMEQGRYTKSETVLRDALELQMQYPGNTHPDQATALNNLGLCCMYQGNFAEAEKCLTQALTMREQLTDDKLALSLNNLALLYQMQEKYPEAECLYQQAIAIQEQFPGQQNLDLATTLTNLGELYRLKKKYKKAEKLLTIAIDIYKESGQPMPHLGMAKALNNLGLIADERRIYDAAEQCYQFALGIIEHLLGINHPDLVVPLSNLAYLYQRLSMRAQAETLYQRALEIGEEHFGAEHPLTSKVRYRQTSFLAQKPLESRKLGIWSRFFRRNS